MAGALQRKPNVRRLSEFDEALRRTDRLIRMIDVTCGEADALDDVACCLRVAI